MLSDPKKKQLYDSGQMDFDGDGGMGGMGGMGGIDPNDIFRMFMGGGMPFGGMGGDAFSGGGGARTFTFKFG